VDFGQFLPQKDLSLSFEHSRRCDLFIVVGSSLVVTPAADMPREALAAGARLIIINQGETPFDALAHLRFREKIGEVLPRGGQKIETSDGLI
jgi:NAD-dependent deacetylase